MMVVHACVVAGTRSDGAMVHACLLGHWAPNVMHARGMTDACMRGDWDPLWWCMHAWLLGARCDCACMHACRFLQGQPAWTRLSILLCLQSTNAAQLQPSSALEPPPPPPPVAGPKPGHVPVAVLYGTEYGFSKEIAEALCAKLAAGQVYWWVGGWVH